MRARSWYAHGCASHEPRTALANSERVARRARHRGCILFGDFLLGKQEKVTRSPQASGSSALNLKHIMAMTILAIGLAAGASGAMAQSEPAARTAQETQAKQKLDEVRTEIRKISEAQKELANKKNDADADLREQELKIASRRKTELDALKRQHGSGESLMGRLRNLVKKDS